MVREDTEREVAMTVLDSLNDMLKTIKTPVLVYSGSSGSPVAILDMVRLVIQRKVSKNILYLKKFMIVVNILV